MSSKKENQVKNRVKLAHNRSQDIYSSPILKNHNSQISKGNDYGFMSPKYKTKISLIYLTI